MGATPAAPAAAVAPAAVADAVAAPDVFEDIVVSFVFNRSFCCWPRS